MSQPGLRLRSGKIITLVPGEQALGGRSASRFRHMEGGEREGSGEGEERKRERGVFG